MSKRLSPAQESLLRYLRGRETNPELALSEGAEGHQARPGTDYRTTRTLVHAGLIRASKTHARSWVVTQAGIAWLSEHPLTSGKVDAS